MVTDRRGQRSPLYFGRDHFRRLQVKRQGLLHKNREIARQNITLRVTVREGRNTDVDSIQSTGIEQGGMAAVGGGAMFGSQSSGSVGIRVSNSGDRNIGET
nr:hypothetical protein [Nonomuraea basaltis]